MELWFEENLHKHWHAKLKADKVLYQVHTDFQDLVIFENGDFGRVLMLDKIIQLTTRDEFVYHEMMAHVPLFAHGEARRVLIVGGGDGGVLREVLRHKTVETAVLCEIDPGVIELCRKYFPEISRGAFDDARAEIVIADAAKYVADTDRKFDVIMVNSTDPIGPGQVLFTEEFYRDCKKRLTARGILVTQQGLPFLQPWEIEASVQLFRQLFPEAGTYLPVTASYLGGHFALGWAANTSYLASMSIEDLGRRYAEAGFDTQYYNPGIHAASFVHPNYLRKLLRGAIEWSAVLP